MKEDSPSSSRGLNLETVEPVAVKKLDSGTGDSISTLRLTVRLVPEDRQTLWKWLADTWRNLWGDSLARCVIIFLFVAISTLVLQRILFFPPLKHEFTLRQFTVFTQYPKWIAPLDEETMSITLLNSGSRDLPQIKVLLVFRSMSFVLTDPEGSTVIKFEDLAPGERKTRTVHFRLERMNQRGPIEVQARLISKERGMESILFPSPIRVISAPYYKTWVQKGLGVLTGILGAVLALVGERFSSILGLKK